MFIDIQVDCTANTKVCEKYGVSGYPTLKVFREGDFAYEYEGQRDGGKILEQLTSFHSNFY